MKLVRSKTSKQRETFSFENGDRFFGSFIVSTLEEEIFFILLSLRKMVNSSIDLW